jgi:glycosyltransferase involved in cell wall biosynthesis
MARAHDLLHAHGEVASALCLPSLATRPSVVTLHGLHLLRRLDGLYRQAAIVNLRLIVGAASKTICVSESEYTDALAAVPGSGRLTVIRNSVALPSLPTPQERDRIRAALGIQAGTTVGIFVGSLEAHKDPLTAVRAALRISRSASDFLLVLAGDGPLRDAVARAADGAESVRLLGQRNDVRQLLAAADFFVLPSEREGASLALLEAMAMGLVPIVSDTPGNADVVGAEGSVVPCGDVAAFAAAFERMRRKDPNERSVHAHRLRERVARRYSLEEMLRRTRQVYDEVLAEQS